MKFGLLCEHQLPSPEVPGIGPGRACGIGRVRKESRCIVVDN
jgi:hypothetical protein